jgi:outer membrane lipoprotein carrier protein
MVSLRPSLAKVTPRIGTAVVVSTLLGAALPARAQVDPLLEGWLDAQTNILSWSADFTQTRTLKTLVHPLVASGHVWFHAPSRFRWELGQPPQTIAVRQTNALEVLYPRLKRAELYPLQGDAGQWRDVLALLDAGFARSKADLLSRYNVLRFTHAEDRARATLQPKSPSARRMMPQIEIDFSTTTHELLGTQLQFADGSTLRNDFTNAVINPPIDPARFQPDLAGYKLVEPLKDR